MSSRVTVSLVGRDRELRRSIVLASAGLAVASFAAVSLARRLVPGLEPLVGSLFFPLVLWNSWPAVAVVVVPAWMALPAAVGYRRGGLLVGWALLFGPLFGGLSNDFVVENICCGSARTSPPPVSTYTFSAVATNVFLAVVAALAFALVLGTIGYVVGLGANRLVRRRSAGRDA